MAIDVSGSGVRGRRSSNKGRAYSRISKGVEITQKWPKKRGKKLNPKTAAQMEYFRQVQWAYKYSDPMVQVSYAQAVKGTPLMPRDLFLMAVSGRMHAFVTPSGKKMFPMAAVKDISASLDVLAQLPGTILARNTDLWFGLTPGPAGQVLTSTGETTPPEYAAPVVPTGATWGEIDGTLSDQLDLEAALDARPTLAGDNVFTGNNEFDGTISTSQSITSDVGVIAGSLLEIAPALPRKSRWTLNLTNAGTNPGHIDNYDRGVMIYQSGSTPGVSGAMRAALENITLTPGFTVQARINLIDPSQASGQFQGGIVIHNTANGRFLVWGQGGTGTTLYGQIYSSATSGQVGQYCAVGVAYRFPWIRLRTTSGGSIFFECSVDGYNWLTIGSTTFSNYIGAADYAGIGCYAIGGVTTMNGLLCQSYRLQ